MTIVFIAVVNFLSRPLRALAESIRPAGTDDFAVLSGRDPEYADLDENAWFEMTLTTAELARR